MKLKISLLLGIIVCLLFNNKVCAQTIGLSGPTTVVPSGTIVTFTATGESANKYIASVPQNADASYYVVNHGVTCPLWDTINYFEETGQPGKFNYKLINTNTVAKTVKLNFTMFIATKTNGSTSFANQNVSYTVTIGPAAPVGVDPATLTKINSMGFATDGISLGNDYYLVEDDIMLSKAYVNSYSSSTPPISLLNDNINISIDQSVWADHIWDNAMYYAVTAWNSQTNCNVKINVVQKVSGGNFALPNTIDIEMKKSSDPVKVPVISRFTINDGKPGHQILFNPNFKYAGSNLTVSVSQATWNLVQAIGHCLGIKHATGTGSQSSVMLRGTASNSYNNNLSSVYDSQVLGSKFPINSSSQVVPFISGINSLHPYESASYLISYWEAGIKFTWKAIGINGTVYNEDYGPMTAERLPEVYFPAGNYRIQCTISGGKYSTPVTVTKDILVQ